ncbi:1006_t:CDS:2, partial [Entrophospora sp. SA101]
HFKNPSPFNFYPVWKINELKSSQGIRYYKKDTKCRSGDVVSTNRSSCINLRFYVCEVASWFQ